MNTLRNNARLIGHLGGDSETKQLESGKEMTRFTLATNETYKDENGKEVTETTWHSVIVWGKYGANLSKYLKKGKEIAVTGRISNRSYTGTDGVKRSSTEIIANELLLLDKPKKVD